MMCRPPWHGYWIIWETAKRLTGNGYGSQLSWLHTRLTTVVAEWTIRNGTALDKARVNFNGLRLFTFVDDPVHQHIEGRFTEGVLRLVDGGQRRREEARVAHVVIADHGNILRHAQAQLIG